MLLGEGLSQELEESCGKRFDAEEFDLICCHACRMAGCKSMAGALEERCQWLMQATQQADMLYTECHSLW